MGTFARRAVAVAALVGLASLLSLGACSDSEGEGDDHAEHAHSHSHSHDEGGGDWLKGNTAEKLETVATHLRGFGVAMAEINYRYHVLFWAGQDGNWGMADHQLLEIREALELAIERRPEHGASAQPTLTSALPALGEAVRLKNTALFNERFTNLTASCNACHVMEKVPFVVIQEPRERMGLTTFGRPQ